MSAVRRVLVVGAGAAGAAIAILLADAGVSVDLVETKSDIGGYGSGITLQGNALRVLRTLGVWEVASTRGFSFDTLGLRAPDADGTLLVELNDVRSGGPDLPATMGMYRPTLARIMVERAREVGASVRLGTTCLDLRPHDDGVFATFDDQTQSRYDMVVGADGVRSATRRRLGIDVEPLSVGMGIWRVLAPRPASVTRTDLYYGGPSYIAGYCPTGPNSLYAYIVEDAQDRSGLSQPEQLEVVRELASAYHGPWDDIRSSLGGDSAVNYTWFEQHLLDPPWHRGRIVLIGDAAHSCPPTLAQGAAMALEDAVVLAEVLTTHASLTEEMWQEFYDRRFGRAKQVVEASLQLAAWLLAHEQGDVPSLMAGLADLSNPT